ncbi:MAG: hypothetical protein E6H67_13915 [Betaproteobacteria bacterium]|nr:MAG: hypothetical protein E6H67_13915 [Betaproteobacteria bacterium]
MDQAYSDALALLEDRDVTNQFNAMASRKPGLVRLWTLLGILATVDYAARHIVRHGRLGRIRTIHFARWVLLDGRKRGVFFSNYDGTVESYMDDFINKAGFGLNAIFCNAIGYPRTNWLVLDGCSDEQKYRSFLRRHTLPSQVWYKAYPGLTAIEGNPRVGRPSMNPSEVDYSDVQGLVRFGYGKMKEASYVHLRVKDVAAARAWLRSAPVTSAVATTPPPSTAMQVAFTAAGLEALGVPASVRAGFSAEFLAGMIEENRSRRLGDVGSNAPSQWEWGYGAGVPHLMVMFFAEPGRLQALTQGCKVDAWNEAFDELRWLGTADLDGVEPFGFADGISQPQLDWER